MRAPWQQVPAVLGLLPLTRLHLVDCTPPTHTLAQRLSGGMPAGLCSLAPTLQVGRWAGLPLRATKKPAACLDAQCSKHFGKHCAVQVLRLNYPVCMLPAVVSALTHLTRLSLGGREVASLPAWLTRLTGESVCSEPCLVDCFALSWDRSACLSQCAGGIVCQAAFEPSRHCHPMCRQMLQSWSVWSWGCALRCGRRPPAWSNCPACGYW